MKSTELVKYRKSNKMSQYDLANVMKVSRGAVAHWEKAEELPEKVASWLREQIQKREAEEESFLGSAVAYITRRERAASKLPTPPRASVLNKRNVQVTRVVNEAVTKSLREHKQAALDLDARVDLLLDELKAQVVDTIKRILGA